jgi:hypothetical protein
MAFTPGAANGSDAGWIRYQYELNGNGAWSALDGGGVITGLGNGTSYTVKLRAVTTADGATYTGNASLASAQAVPFGPIGNPGIVSARGSGNVRFNIAAPATNGRPITLIEYRTRGDSSGWSAWTNSGVTSGNSDVVVYTSAPGDTAYIEVRVWAQDTPAAGGNSASNRSNDKSSWVSKGKKEPGFPNSPHLVINWSEFQTVTYTLTCRDDWGADDYITQTKFTVNATSSSGSKELPCFFGYGGYHVYIHWESGPGAPFNSDVLTW